MKNIRDFLSEKFQFLEVKFSIYLNRCVFIMGQSMEEQRPKFDRVNVASNPQFLMVRHNPAIRYYVADSPQSYLYISPARACVSCLLLSNSTLFTFLMPCMINKNLRFRHICKCT